MPETFGSRLRRSFNAALRPTEDDLTRKTIVKEYSSRGAYDRDVDGMATKGFAVVSVVESTQRAGCIRMLTLGLFALVWRPKPHLVVTYSRS